MRIIEPGSGKIHAAPVEGGPRAEVLLGEEGERLAAAPTLEVLYLGVQYGWRRLRSSYRVLSPYLSGFCN